MAIRRGPGYHLMWGEMEKREKERKAYQRQVEREWKEKCRKSQHQRKCNKRSTPSYSGYTHSILPKKKGASSLL